MQYYEPQLASLSNAPIIDNFCATMSNKLTPSSVGSDGHDAAGAAIGMTPVVGEEHRCRYSNKKCLNPRAKKRTGGLHTFCVEHRENANRNQRKVDQKKRVEKRQQEAVQTYYETMQAVQRLEDQQAQQPLSAPPISHLPEMLLGSVSSVAVSEASAIIEPYARPATLLDEDLDVLVSLFGPADITDADFEADGSYQP